MFQKLLRSPRILQRLINLWPPFLGAGIHVELIAANWDLARVSMPLRFYNKNYVGTHFGGSLFAMVDPFLMLLAMNRLGADYVVWDKAGAIDFRKPGRGRVRAEIAVDDQLLKRLQDGALDGSAHFESCHIEIKDETGDIVALVTKTLFVRKKRPKKTREKT